MGDAGGNSGRGRATVLGPSEAPVTATGAGVVSAVARFASANRDICHSCRPCRRIGRWPEVRVPRGRESRCASQGKGPAPHNHRQPAAPPRVGTCRHRPQGHPAAGASVVGLTLAPGNLRPRSGDGLFRSPASPRRWDTGSSASSPGGSHPGALTEPDVSLSTHPAPLIPPLGQPPFASEQIVQVEAALCGPASAWPAVDACTS